MVQCGTKTKTDVNTPKAWVISVTVFNSKDQRLRSVGHGTINSLPKGTLGSALG